MTEYADLRDERIFPTFSHCPDEGGIDPNFYTLIDGISKPNRHWCLLTEIVKIENIIRLPLLTKDSSGEAFRVAFYLDGFIKLDLSKFKVGYTIAILYAQQYGFLDSSLGVKQEDASTFKVNTNSYFIQK